MNAATAAGILGGAVDATVASSAGCEFVRKKSPSDTLRIQVGTNKLDKTEICGSSATPLKGIGNEAVACAETEKSGGRIEWIVGRVRDQNFAIRIGTADPSTTQASLLEKAKAAAEQVAGNLF